MRITKAITIEAPKAAVFRTFANVERWSEWSPWGLEFEDAPRLAIGERFRVVVPAPLLSFVTLRFPCEVTLYDNPKQVCWTGRILFVRGHHLFRFEESGGGCRVTSEEEFSGALALLLWPVRFIIERRVTTFLRSLRGAAGTASG